MTDRITVIGNIGRAPERKTTPKGDVVEFSLARNQRVQAEDGGWRDGETLWYRVSAWDRLGASAADALQRGQRVIVQGWLHERRWTGKDGVERLSRDVRAEAIGQDISQRSGQHTGAPAPAPAADRQAATQEVDAPPQRAPGDWGARPEAVAPPAPAGWSGTDTQEGDAPF